MRQSAGIPVDLRAADNGGGKKLDDVALMPADIVVVPRSVISRPRSIRKAVRPEPAPDPAISRNPDVAQGEEDLAMQDAYFEQWLQFALRRRVIMAEVAAAIMAAVVAATFLWPPVYRSSAEIMVQDNRAQLLVSPALENNAPNQPAVVANAVTEEDLNSERELLSSDYLIQQALAGLPGPKDGAAHVLVSAVEWVLDFPTWLYAAVHGASAPTPTEQWAHRVERHLSSSVIKRSNVIEIAFTSHDPKWSHDFLQRLIDKYLEFHSSMSHDPQAEQFFERQAKLLQGRLHAVEDQLRAYQVQTGVTNPYEQKQALITRIAQLQNDAARPPPIWPRLKDAWRCFMTRPGQFPDASVKRPRWFRTSPCNSSSLRCCNWKRSGPIC